jgi:hypothetical protein
VRTPSRGYTFARPCDAAGFGLRGSESWSPRAPWSQQVVPARSARAKLRRSALDIGTRVARGRTSNQETTVKLLKAPFLAFSTSLCVACSAPTERALVVTCVDSPAPKQSERKPTPSRAKHKRTDAASAKPETVRVDPEDAVKSDVARVVVDKSDPDDGSHEAQPNADLDRYDDEVDDRPEVGESGDDNDASNASRDDESDAEELADLEDS